MSWQATSWVIAHSKHKGSALLTLLCIANCANETGSDCWPNKERLTRDTRLSPRQLDRIVNALEASGELSVKRSQGRHPNHYSFPLMRANPDKMTGFTEKPTPSQLCPPNPVISDANPVIAMTPEQSVERSNERSVVDFWTRLQSNPAYSHVDLEIERQKMELWCDANRRKLSYRFAVNWLNRIPKPKSSPRKVSDPEYQKELEERWRNQKSA